MRNLLVPIFMVLLATLPARADATLTCNLTGAGAANTSVPLVFTDANGTRILAAAVRSYSPVTVAPALPSSDPICIATPQDARCLPTQRQATNNEAATWLLRDLLNTIPANVTASDRIAAGNTASGAIVPVAPK